MHERHELEQYFFDAPTLRELTELMRRFQRPCVLCAPMLGRQLAEAGVQVRILDVDERFASTPGFLRWDLQRPAWIGEAFDVIFCDPPFFGPSLTELFAALRTLSRNDFSQPLLLTYLRRRGPKLLRTFDKFNLRPTGYQPRYATLADIEKNDIELYGNLSLDGWPPVGSSDGPIR